MKKPMHTQLPLLGLCVICCLMPMMPVSAENAKPSPDAYAAVKKDPGSYTTREKLTFRYPGSYPARGFMLAEGGFLTGGASWKVVDLDSSMLTCMLTNNVGNGSALKTEITQQKKVPLMTKDINEMIELANQIWNPPPPTAVPRAPVMDATRDLVLFDGEKVDRVYGFEDESKPLILAINKLCL